MNKEIIVDMRDIIDSVISQLQSGPVTITGCGKSMEPFIADGQDKIVLEKIESNNKIKVGEIYLYKRADQRYAIHRIYKICGNSLLTLGDSQLTNEEIPQKNLIAKITKVIKTDGSIIDCTDCDVIRKSVRNMNYRIRKHKQHIFISSITPLPSLLFKKIISVFRKKG